MKSISTLFRQLSLIVVLISAFSLSAWGETTVEMTTFSATSASMDNVISYSTAKGGGTSNPAINSEEIRLYQNSAGTGGGYITITATGNYTISSVTIGSSMATLVAHTIGSSTTKSSNSNLGKNGKHTISDINDQSVTIYCMGKDKNSRLYVNYLSVTYSDNNSDPETPCTEPEISFAESTITKTNGDDPFTNTLTTNSSGEVTYTSSATNVAIVDNDGQVTIKGVGTTTITATVAADGTYCEDTDEYTLTVQGRQFNIRWMNGTETYETTTYTESETLKFPVAPTPSPACQNAGWEFAGWSTTKITEDATSATLLTGTYTPTANITLYAVYKLEGTSSTGSAEAWALTDIAYISATDEVVITMTYTDGTIYALSSSNKASSAPTATTLTASNNNLSEAPTDDLVWNISKNDDSYTIYPNGTTETWLYCFSDNNGVRVGTNTNKTFIIDPTSGYLKNTETSRYLGVYRTNPDWRCYTNTTGNTANQTLGFYVKTGGTQTTITYNSNPNCETPIVATPTFIPENGKVDGENKFTEPFSLTIASATDDAIIHYSIDGVNFNTYTTPITISSTTTIQAYATADGYDDSNTAEVTYTFIETHTVIWYDGEGTTEEKYTDGATLNLPITTPTSSHDEYNNFVGWTASPSGYSGIINPEEPTYVSSTTMVKSDMNLYAVFNNASLSTTLVTDATNLAVGDKIIIAAKGSDFALSTTQNNNNRGQASITKDGNIIKFGEDVQVLTLEGGTVDNTFAFNTGSGYLYAASSGSNYLRTQTTNDDNGSWNITITDSVATIKAQGANTRNWLRYNSSNKIFSCYGSGQQDVSIYKISGTLPTGWTINTTTTNDDVVVRANKTLNIYQTTTANTLTIKSILDEAGQVAVTSGSLTAQKVVVEKTIDSTRWFFFSLPFDCKIDDIVAIAANGDSLTYYTDYVISKYNPTREEGQTNAWEDLLGTDKLNANQGYIIGHWYEQSDNIIVKFPSTDAQTITAPADKTLNYTDTWFVDEENSSKGFNLIGMPYYQNINSNISCDSINIYSTTPNKDGKTYTQEVYTGNNVAPFTSFFVQVAENTAPTFTISPKSTSAPMLRAKDVVAKATITLADANGGADETTVINNPTKTTDYEIGHDLVKWIGYAEIPQIYSLQGDEMLAFNSFAIDNSTVIPLGVYAHADGDYTFSLSEKSVGDLEGWELYDNETGKTTRLANEDLTVNLAQGTHEGRFEIRLQQRITTDCDNAMGNMTTWTANGTLNINNLPADAVVYIYDAVGRMVYVANNNSTTLNYTFAARGVYNIVVRTAENSVSFKTIY